LIELSTEVLTKAFEEVKCYLFPRTTRESVVRFIHSTYLTDIFIREELSHSVDNTVCKLKSKHNVWLLNIKTKLY